MSNAAKVGDVIFRDDFDGPALNLSAWTPNWLGSPTQITPPINGQEVQAYDPAQVTLEDGHLVLAAAQRAVVDSHGTRHSYVSGCVTTHGKVQFSPAVKIRARIQLPGTGKGDVVCDNWPGFWCDGMSWPGDGENDIVEGLHGHAAYHFHSAAHPEGVGAAGALDPTKKWHAFESDWYPDHIDYFYDHEHVGTLTQAQAGLPQPPKPMYLILNLGLSTSISPPLVVPSRMLVDFVEVSRIAA